MDHEEVLIGTVGRANGLKGDVVVRVRTDEPEMRFAVGAHVRLADRISRSPDPDGSRDHSSSDSPR